MEEIKIYKYNDKYYSNSPLYDLGLVDPSKIGGDLHALYANYSSMNDDCLILFKGNYTEDGYTPLEGVYYFAYEPEIQSTNVDDLVEMLFADSAINFEINVRAPETAAKCVVCRRNNSTKKLEYLSSFDSYGKDLNGILMINNAKWQSELDINSLKDYETAFTHLMGITEYCKEDEYYYYISEFNCFVNAKLL